ncbi:hypothetical protein SGGMMB4_00721 [Sodalis glossinidius str. 'morsitans']|uniref:Uncharacterized protein n=1 Tax=Sodalis glossinidius (strain morsitans) TaxID=343509 RepID=A0A193QFM3_SODGM|nr:hypothetical protein SGGMMB4_00721 [Sodalis glossinidius str. 'morsitans']
MRVFVGEQNGLRAGLRMMFTSSFARHGSYFFRQRGKLMSRSREMKQTGG